MVVSNLMALLMWHVHRVISVKSLMQCGQGFLIPRGLQKHQDRCLLHDVGESAMHTGCPFGICVQSAETTTN